MLAHFDKYSKIALGKFFREQRELKNVTQLELARNLNLSSSQHISNVERGNSTFTSEQIKKVVDVLELELIVIKELLIDEMLSSFQRNWEEELGEY